MINAEKITFRRRKLNELNMNDEKTTAPAVVFLVGKGGE